MQQLLSIETVPIIIEYVEKQPSLSSQGTSAQLEVMQNDHEMTIRSNPIPILWQDTFERGSSDDYSGLSYTATAQYSNNGFLSMNVQINNGETNDFAYKKFGRCMENMMDSLTFSKNRRSPALQNFKIDFDMRSLPKVRSASKEIDTSFMPPDLELKVVQHPKVIIKYIGGPIYFPKSADPDYEPPADEKQAKSSFDKKI